MPRRCHHRKTDAIEKKHEIHPTIDRLGKCNRVCVLRNFYYRTLIYTAMVSLLFLPSGRHDKAYECCFGHGGNAMSPRTYGQHPFLHAFTLCPIGVNHTKITPTRSLVPGHLRISNASKHVYIAIKNTRLHVDSEKT